MAEPVEIRYAAQRKRRATRPLECSGGSAWCTQTIQPGDWYTALVQGDQCVGKWCDECRRVLGRW